jgi:hypothetical protein
MVMKVEAHWGLVSGVRRQGEAIQRKRCERQTKLNDIACGVGSRRWVRRLPIALLRLTFSEWYEAGVVLHVGYELEWV